MALRDRNSLFNCARRVFLPRGTRVAPSKHLCGQTPRFGESFSKTEVASGESWMLAPGLTGWPTWGPKTTWSRVVSPFRERGYLPNY